jgi:stage II sporulation protein D
MNHLRCSRSRISFESSNSVRRASALVGVLLILLSVLPAGCRGGASRGGAAIDGVPVVRVRLAASVDRAMLSADQPAVFRSDAEPQPRKLNFPPGQEIPVVRDGAGWRIGGNITIAGGELHVQPGAEGGVAVNGARYHGHYRLVATTGTGSDKFDVVNHVDVESYLQGVLPREMFPNWDVEAYKAQAIAARTYALYELRTTRAEQRHWDVYADTRSQVYGGIKGESAKGNEAVDATRGIVAAYGPRGRERIFKAYFSACCGGVAQNVTDAMGGAYIPPLGDKNVGTLCGISPRFRWQPVSIDKQELTRRMRAWGAARDHPLRSMQALDRIDVAYVNRFGRPVRFIVTDAAGKQYLLGSEEARWACNHDRGQGAQLWSSYFKPVNQPDAVVFTEGRGFGHGVGLCQWCAQALALQDVPAEEIVRFSYPSAVLVRAY